MKNITLDKAKILKSFYENKAALEKRNAEGIEKYRKGTFTLSFSDEGNKKVSIKQKSHKFLFGSTAFMLGSFEIAEKEEIFKRKFVKLFNQAVVPFYWSDLEPEKGKLRFSRDSENIYRRPAPDLVLDFCKEYGIEPKGHCLLWSSCVPQWLGKYSVEERKKIVERRFLEISERYADIIPSFDVINESATNYNHGRKRLFEDYDEYALLLGGKYFSNNRKIINETNGAIWYDFYRKGKYMSFNMQLKEFISKNLPIDEIGLQYHIFVPAEQLADQPQFDWFLDAQNMIDILEIYNNYKLPIHISEITIPSYWTEDNSNEELQAELTEILYKTWFATENMKSIVWWNLADGYAYNAEAGDMSSGENSFGGGLLRFDMSEKPSYKVLDRLINKEWKTSFTENVSGKWFSFRGFYGDYEIEIEDEYGKKTTVDAKLLNDNDVVKV